MGVRYLGVFVKWVFVKWVFVKWVFVKWVFVKWGSTVDETVDKRIYPHIYFLVAR